MKFDSEPKQFRCTLRVGGAFSVVDRGVDMLSKDVEYYRQRASAERRLALASSQQNVAEIHEELARQYQGLIDHVELRPTGTFMLPEAASA